MTNRAPQFYRGATQNSIIVSIPWFYYLTQGSPSENQCSKWNCDENIFLKGHSIFSNFPVFWDMEVNFLEKKLKNCVIHYILCILYIICMISNVSCIIYNSMHFSKKCQGEMYASSSGTVKIYTHACILKYTICVPLQSMAIFAL